MSCKVQALDFPAPDGHGATPWMQGATGCPETKQGLGTSNAALKFKHDRLHPSQARWRWHAMHAVVHEPSRLRGATRLKTQRR